MTTPRRAALTGTGAGLAISLPVALVAQILAATRDDEVPAPVVIGLAAVQGTIGALLLFLPGRRLRAAVPGSAQDAKEAVRLRLGRWLAVALEFETAADILRTAVAPTWNEIGQLAAIVVLRTALNYFLQREIDKAESRGTGAVAPGRAG